MENNKLDVVGKMTLDSFVNSVYAEVIKENSIQFSDSEREIFKTGFYECLKMVGNGRMVTKDDKTYVIKR